jgi:hypothetical protein
MASGHVNRANQAEHMAAPHRNLRREDFSCQFGAVHTWPKVVKTLGCGGAKPSPALFRQSGQS